MTAPNASGPPAIEPFGYKLAWWAIRGWSPDRIAKLKLHDAEPAGWAAGIEAATSFRMFVTPSTFDGWVFAASNASLVETESPEALKLSLELISKAPGVTDAQFFASDRVIDLYA